MILHPLVLIFGLNKHYKNDIYDFENNYASCTSLEIPINNDDGFLSEVIPDKDATVEEDIMNKELSLIVNSAMNKYLTDREINIVKRGRNYKKNRHPRHTDIITYKLSTGFETLIGYLYLNNEKKRVEEIITYILGGPYEENF